MTSASDNKAAGVTKTARAPAAKPAGVIVHNKNLNCWRCVNAAGREVLSTGSKETAMKRFPNFVVKE